MTSGEQEIDWRLVLDANVLLQAPMRDTMLRLAQERIVTVFWSDAILAEVERNFPKVSGASDAARRFARLLSALRQHFPRAFVTEGEETMRVAAITSHDRHVLTCALAAPAPLKITYNIRHFPAHTLAPYSVQAWHPDRLLSALLLSHPDELLAVLLAQGRDLHPPRSLHQILTRLADDVPGFVLQARQRFGL